MACELSGNMRLSHLNESDNGTLPKEIRALYGTVHEVLKAADYDGWTFVLVRAIEPVKSASNGYKDTYYYDIFAFKHVEGIGGRMMRQWNTALLMDTYFHLGRAEEALNKWASYRFSTSFALRLPYEMEPQW